VPTAHAAGHGRAKAGHVALRQCGIAPRTEPATAAYSEPPKRENPNPCWTNHRKASSTAALSLRATPASQPSFDQPVDQGPRAQPAVQSEAPIPSLVLAASPHCRSATWAAFARPCPQRGRSARFIRGCLLRSLKAISYFQAITRAHDARAFFRGAANYPRTGNVHVVTGRSGLSLPRRSPR